MKTILLVALCILPSLSMPVLANDWAYELSDKAKEIYVQKKLQISCSYLEYLIHSKHNSRLFTAIRDAALFRDTSCKKIIRKNIQKLKQKKDASVRAALNYYLYVNGDKARLKYLAKSFDTEAKKVGDHWTVEIFGFMPDWDVSGRRLVRHSKWADGAASELLCSAIKWRRFLYGEVNFTKNWLRIGKQEKVPKAILEEKIHFCIP